jgi:hypothetical protein
MATRRTSTPPSRGTSAAYPSNFASWSTLLLKLYFHLIVSVKRAGASYSGASSWGASHGYGVIVGYLIFLIW